MACTDLVAATQAWHEDRLAKLTADDGWLTLVGLHWLKEGPNMFGSMSESDIVFPANFPCRFERFETQRTLRVPNVLGDITDMLAPGQVVFNVNGQEYHLTPVADPDDPELFFIFRDLTSSTETYGSGRFLYADRPQDGEVILDFNCAYNPPCAFTPFATCPLPPPENRLNVRIEAGEKRVGDH
eukprot:GGOE01018810.1.p1 GENE.GGOE01018810.1~~GGOE01018810.1.p1  ORF type:complete len:196 (+),score=10.27 GGOE01018810.1:39-590(+)